MKRTTFLLLLAMTGTFMDMGFAHASLSIPRVMNFQSVLRDDAGNLIPDGTTSLDFRILDADGHQLYFETQAEVPVVRGSVNAMIGEGDIPGSSTPTGGIPSAALDPTTGEKLLQYRIGNNEPVDPIEFGLMPYAFWSEKSLGVVNDAIGSDQIRNGSIKIEDLEPNTISFGDVGGLINPSQIPTSIARLSDVTNHINNPSAAHRASAIATDGPFGRSRSTTVENVLQDLDRALTAEIADRQNTRDTFSTTLTILNNNLTNEASTRASADAGLQRNIDNKVSKSGDVMTGPLNVPDDRNIAYLNGGSFNVGRALRNHDDRLAHMEGATTIVTTGSIDVEAAFASVRRADFTVPVVYYIDLEEVCGNHIDHSGLVNPPLNFKDGRYYTAFSFTDNDFHPHPYQDFTISTQQETRVYGSDDGRPCIRTRIKCELNGRYFTDTAGSTPTFNYTVYKLAD